MAIVRYGQKHPLFEAQTSLGVFVHAFSTVVAMLEPPALRNGVETNCRSFPSPAPAYPSLDETQLLTIMITVKQLILHMEQLVGKVYMDTVRIFES